MKNIAISACLLGQNCRYDGSNKLNVQIKKLVINHNVIQICPEAVFDVPHKPIELKNGKAYMADGSDATEILKQSCQKVFDEIKDCDFAILKSKSPTCGYQKIYDGTFTNKLIDGNGMLTQLLLDNGIKVYSELQIDEITRQLDENGGI